MAASLKGFFDSEGSISLRFQVWGYNNDVALLRYVMMLLHEYFGIETTGLHLGKRKGSKLERRGKVYFRNSDSYVIYVKRNSVNRFASVIGFTILRKQRRQRAFLAMKDEKSDASLWKMGKRRG